VSIQNRVRQAWHRITRASFVHITQPETPHCGQSKSNRNWLPTVSVSGLPVGRAWLPSSATV